MNRIESRIIIESFPQKKKDTTTCFFLVISDIINLNESSQFNTDILLFWFPVWRRKFLYKFCHILFLLILKIIYVWYTMSQQLRYKSIQDIICLVDNYYLLLLRITYWCYFKWCGWCWGGSSYISSAIYYSCSFSK